MFWDFEEIAVSSFDTGVLCARPPGTAYSSEKELSTEQPSETKTKSKEDKKD